MFPIRENLLLSCGFRSMCSQSKCTVDLFLNTLETKLLRFVFPLDSAEHSSLLCAGIVCFYLHISMLVLFTLCQVNLPAFLHKCAICSGSLSCHLIRLQCISWLASPAALEVITSLHGALAKCKLSCHPVLRGGRNVQQSLDGQKAVSCVCK